MFKKIKKYLGRKRRGGIPIETSMPMDGLDSVFFIMGGDTKEIDVIDEVTVTKDDEVILHLFIDDLNDLKAIIKGGFEVKVNGDKLTE